MSIGRLSIGETVKEVVNRAIIELQERWDTISDFTLTLISLTTAAAWRAALGIIDPLSATRTYYVRTDGSNSNTGLVDSAGGAFLTLQKAITTAAAVIQSGFAIMIQVRSGTFTGATVVDTPFTGGRVTIIGDVTTPANCLLSTTGAPCIQVTNNCEISIQGFEVRTTGAAGSFETLTAPCFDIKPGGVLNINGNMRFGACAGWHILSEDGGTCLITTNYTISGSAGLSHWGTVIQGVIKCTGRVITLSGTPAFPNGFADCTTNATMRVEGNTFVGAATGPHYRCILRGLIYTGFAGENYLPGNAAGTNDGTGLYT